MRIGGIKEVNNLYQVNSYAPIQKVNGQKKDELQLSSAAVACHKAKQLAKEVPDIRQDKVDAIKARIASGNYNIEAKEVAEKIVSQFDMRG